MIQFVRSEVNPSSPVGILCNARLQPHFLCRSARGSLVSRAPLPRPSGMIDERFNHCASAASHTVLAHCERRRLRGSDQSLRLAGEQGCSAQHLASYERSQPPAASRTRRALAGSDRRLGQSGQKSPVCCRRPQWARASLSGPRDPS